MAKKAKDLSAGTPAATDLFVFSPADGTTASRKIASASMVTAMSAYAVTLTVGASNALDTDSTHYDYFCDGTADEVQINLAVAAIPAAGGRILLSEGLFTVAAAIVCAKSNVVIEGQGTGTEITIANAADVDIIQLGDGATPFSGIVVRNLMIDGNMANQTAGFSNGINIRVNVSDSVIEGCWIQNTGACNITDNGLNRNMIYNNYCDTTKSGSSCGNIEGFSTNGRCLDNTCLTGDYAGIAITQHSSILVDGNTIRGCAARFISVSARLNIISNNFLYANADVSEAMIVLNSGGQVVDIHDNTIQIENGPTAAVTCIKSSTWGANIFDNLILIENVNFGHKAIDASGGEASIQGNYIFNEAEGGNNNGSRGMIIGTTTNAICGNYIDGFDTAIECFNCNAPNITGNMLINSGVGLEIALSIGGVVSGNAFNSNTVGLQTSSTSFTTGLSITGNTFYVTSHEAIIAKSMKHCAITGNVFKDSGRAANNTYASVLFMTSSGTNYSTGNTVTGNTFSSTAANKPSYNIRENSVNDGPNIVACNVASNAVTSQISLQHGSSIDANNLTI